MKEVKNLVHVQGGNQKKQLSLQTLVNIQGFLTELELYLHGKYRPLDTEFLERKKSSLKHTLEEVERAVLNE